MLKSSTCDSIFFCGIQNARLIPVCYRGIFAVKRNSCELDLALGQIID